MWFYYLLLFVLKRNGSVIFITWPVSLSTSILHWRVSIVPYNTYFTAGVFNLLQHPLSITLLCDAKTSVYVSVWSSTLFSNLFNSPICFPAKSLSETTTARTWIFLWSYSALLPFTVLFCSMKQAKGVWMSCWRKKQYNKTIVYLFIFIITPCPKLMVSTIMTFWVLLATFQPEWPLCELVALFCSLLWVQSRILFLPGCVASSRGMHLVSEHVVPSYNISGVIKARGLLQSGETAKVR